MAEYSSSLELKPKGFDKLERRMKGVQSNISGINTKLRNTQGQFTKIGKNGSRDLNNTVKATDNLSNSMTKLKGLAIGLVASLSAIQSIRGLTSATVEFERYEAQLKTMTGSMDNASAAMKRLQNFAERTPFDLKQSIDGFVKLKALGLDPSEKAMTSYGNTAAAMGKSLEQMVEAVADASTMEFERLKEFGIKARQNKDTVDFTFRGTTTSVKKNAAEIEKYLMGIGETQFGGAMAERTKGLESALSNLSANWRIFLATFSKETGLAALFTDVLNSVSSSLKGITSILKGQNESFNEFSSGIKRFVDGYIVAFFDLEKYGPTYVLRKISVDIKAALLKIRNIILTTNILDYLKVGILAAFVYVQTEIEKFLTVYYLYTPLRAWNNFWDNEITSSVVGLSANFDLMIGTVKKALVRSFLSNIVQPLILLYGNMVHKVARFIYDNPVLNAMFESFENSLNFVDRLFEDFTDSVGDSFKDLGYKVYDVIISTVPKALSAAIRFIKEDFHSGFQEITSKGLFKSLWDSVKNIMSVKYAELKRETRELVKDIIGSFYRLYDVLVGHSIVPDLVDRIKYIWNGMKDYVVSTTDFLSGMVIYQWASLSDSVLLAVKSMAYFINKFLGKEVISGNFSKIVSTYKSQLDRLGQIAGKLGTIAIPISLYVRREDISNWFKELGDSIRGRDTSRFVELVTRPVDLYLSRFVKSIHMIFEALVDSSRSSTKSISDNVKRLLPDTLDSIKEFSDTIESALGPVLGTIYSMVATGFQFVKETVATIVSVLTVFEVRASSIVAQVIGYFVTFKIVQKIWKSVFSVLSGYFDDFLSHSMKTIKPYLAGLGKTIRLQAEKLRGTKGFIKAGIYGDSTLNLIKDAVLKFLYNLKAKMVSLSAQYQGSNAILSKMFLGGSDTMNYIMHSVNSLFQKIRSNKWITVGGGLIAMMMFAGRAAADTGEEHAEEYGNSFMSILEGIMNDYGDLIGMAIISGILANIGKIGTILATVGSVLGRAVLAFLSGPVGWVSSIAGIGYFFWDEIKSAAGSFFSWLGDGINSIIRLISNIVDIVTSPLIHLNTAVRESRVLLQEQGRKWTEVLVEGFKDAWIKFFGSEVDNLVRGLEKKLEAAGKNIEDYLGLDEVLVEGIPGLTQNILPMLDSVTQRLEAASKAAFGFMGREGAARLKSLQDELNELLKEENELRSAINATGEVHEKSRFNTLRADQAIAAIRDEIFTRETQISEQAELGYTLAVNRWKAEKLTSSILEEMQKYPKSSAEFYRMQETAISGINSLLSEYGSKEQKISVIEGQRKKALEKISKELKLQLLTESQKKQKVELTNRYYDNQIDKVNGVTEALEVFKNLQEEQKRSTPFGRLTSDLDKLQKYWSNLTREQQDEWREVYQIEFKRLNQKYLDDKKSILKAETDAIKSALDKQKSLYQRQSEMLSGLRLAAMPEGVEKKKAAARAESASIVARAKEELTGVDLQEALALDYQILIQRLAEIDKDASEERITQAENAYNKLRQSYLESGETLKGIVVGIQDFLDTLKNSAEIWAETTNKILGDTRTALIDALSGEDVDFKSVARGILQDISRGFATETVDNFMDKALGEFGIKHEKKSDGSLEYVKDADKATETISDNLTDMKKVTEDQTNKTEGWFSNLSESITSIVNSVGSGIISALNSLASMLGFSGAGGGGFLSGVGSFLGGEFGAALNYGTTFGSEQTAMLAAQDAGFGFFDDPMSWLGDFSFFSKGGIVRDPQYLASGGPVGTDTVPAWLTPGEVVLNAGQQKNVADQLGSTMQDNREININISGNVDQRSIDQIRSVIAQNPSLIHASSEKGRRSGSGLRRQAIT